MKKVLLFAFICIGIFHFSASAEIDIRSNTDGNNCKYVVTADCKKEETVTMVAVKKGSSLNDADIIAVREGKSLGETIVFEFEFEEAAEYEGKYTVYVMNNGSNTKTQKDFTHALNSSINAAKSALETPALDSDGLEDLLKSDGIYRTAYEAMGIKCSVYDSDLNSSQKQAARDMFMSEKATSDDLVKLMNYSIAITIINGGGDTETALSCAVPEFENAEANLKTWLKEEVVGTYTNTEDFAKRYNECCALYKFNNARFSQFTQLFGQYAEDLAITNNAVYRKYMSMTDKSKIGDKLVENLSKNPAKSSLELINALDSACDEVEKANKSSNNSSTGGGGGASGGTGSTAGIIPSGGMSGGGSQAGPQNSSGRYKDIGNVSWAETAINVLSARGVISGDGDGNFRPDDAITREEFVKMIITAIGGVNENAGSSFADLDKSAWYYKYVASAFEIGIISGVSGLEFGVGRRITRQEMAVMISRALNVFKEIQDIRENIEFSDGDEIADWAKNDVLTLYRTGIMSGLDDGRFEPRSGATRAQAAVVVYNLIK